MTRREKILLQICIAIALVGFSFIYLYLPTVKGRAQAIEDRELMEDTQIQMLAVLSVDNVEDNLAKQKQIAEDNYDYFYSKLNTYTIDGIINNIVDSSGVEVLSMNIGGYTDVPSKVLDRKDAKDIDEESLAEEDATVADAGSEEENVLLGCGVNLSVKGTYSQIYKLMDSFKKESPCIEIISTGLTFDGRNVKDDVTYVTMSLMIYGVNEDKK